MYFWIFSSGYAAQNLKTSQKYITNRDVLNYISLILFYVIRWENQFILGIFRPAMQHKI